jgi:hypothetical protein
MNTANNNPAADYQLLADIMQEAAAHFKWKKGRLRLLDVILKLSFRQGLAEAQLDSHGPLLQQTRIKEQKRLSEALSDLVRCGVVQREGKGRGGNTGHIWGSG